ncbi:L-glyceraldehyde 3-phosphate reductase [Kerstersia gyiorum]|uniref:Aldo/keto reductase n=1 Tax=Kerstersia gyiorum TaxID=206506 RepID=A0A171KS47_9BURK|nr:L-glyceraldehyde 3-phosphate reductase [Kerstersia gyiorum]MCO7637720.1 L-glyceraldehyde 3-phosphate reductase [Pseudomonas sp. S 311-6]KKO71714.1 aldo/keto reductase [Kerstersia gyiorum]MCP1633163.1 L-glyceraldehyde 3-phosphate reductase [Kerstersia gyiorum]MCP1636390.1 L-glyceraldehyde 3-phosphate reductase [Kerstersia gyiorum]MCP1670357.1 L-glyceraldehyde 3-phosphate reductase [Kerstersia gyiorum]
MTSREVRFLNTVPDIHRPWQAAPDRYSHHAYRRVGNSGLLLPPISLGLWWNFGDEHPFSRQRDILTHAFDRGITHFDLANNYGPPHGSAEENFGRLLRNEFRPYRSELVVSTKAGWPHWPGPYGNFGSRKYLINSLDESLRRLSTDYVDIFYSHRVDPDTPIEETIGALDTIVRQGKALYVGISSYSAERTQRAVEVARSLGTPLVIHQPAYSLLNRWVEDGLLDTLEQTGLGLIAFTPLAQGLLTDRFLQDRNAAHASKRFSFDASHLSEDNLRRLRDLAAIARERGQTLAQLAIAWLLRNHRVSSVLVGASSTAQLDENLAALANTAFSTEELQAIDQAVQGDSGINLWAQSSDL